MSAPDPSAAGRGAPRYGMVVDLNRCVGCQTCTIACKHHNDTPPGVQWRRVLDVEQGEYPNVERLFLVTGCQHCAEPPCVPVCPTGATRQRADGLVTMDYDTCIGCGYCAVACPYQARTIAHDYEWYYGVPSPQEEQAFDESRIGVASKCTFCVDKIDEAAGSPGVVPGLDLEATPACAASCIAQALHFGDFADPRATSRGSRRRTPTSRCTRSSGRTPRSATSTRCPRPPRGGRGKRRAARAGAIRTTPSSASDRPSGTFGRP